jgi:succinoglycan biosynthesis protein ExoH
MIFFIVVSHEPRFTGFSIDPGVATFILSFIADGLIRLSVPMLSCISGFLVFYTSLDLKFRTLLRKRTASLLMPLLIWNIPLVLLLYLIQSQGWIDHEFAARKTMYPFDLMTWVNGVLSVTDHPINFPLHFLRDLFVICMMAPLMGIFIRKMPWLGLLIVAGVFIPDIDGALIRNNAMIVTFYVGGVAAAQNWNLQRLDRYAIHLLALLAIISIGIVAMDLGRPLWLPLLAPFILWPASSLFVDTAAGRWSIDHSRASFFLFLLHGLVYTALSPVFPKLYGVEFNLGVWLLVPPLIALVCQATYLALARFAPALLTLLMGGRGP